MSVSVNADEPKSCCDKATNRFTLADLSLCFKQQFFAWELDAHSLRYLHAVEKFQLQG